MPEQSEPETIQKAANGDATAFRWLVEKHQGLALSLAYRFVGNTNDAEDITQDAFVRLWKNLPRYRSDVKLTTWLYKIVTNLCLDFLKSRHRKQKVTTESIHADLPVTSASSDQALLDEEFRDVVLRIAEELTPKQKAVFVLRDLEELPVEEVCHILSMPSGNVKSNLYYARMKISEQIRKFYPEK